MGNYLTACNNDTNQLFIVGANAGHGFVQARCKVFGLLCDTLVDGNKTLHNITGELLFDRLLQGVASHVLILLEYL